MRACLFFGLIAALIPFSAGADSAGPKWPDCYCTDKTGNRIELGQRICMVVDGRSFTAECQMSQNNPMWREVGSECLTSQRNAPIRLSISPILIRG